MLSRLLDKDSKYLDSKIKDRSIMSQAEIPHARMFTYVHVYTPLLFIITPRR